MNDLRKHEGLPFTVTIYDHNLRHRHEHDRGWRFREHSN
jgi:hypothetical protein